MTRNMYPMFQDVHVMIFIGYGFLNVYLKSHTWSSIGFNFLVGSWVVQVAILWNHFWKEVALYYDSLYQRNFHRLDMDVSQILIGDYCAASALITFGAVLGKCSLFQMFGVASIHVFFYALNKNIIEVIFKASDHGGSIIIHLFGATFGLVTSLFYQKKAALADKHQMDEGNYLSDLVSIIGTLFLFCYWPSFNGATLVGGFQERAVINTYLSLSVGVICSIFWSKIIYGKLDMEIVLMASIAGGVAMGCNAPIITKPFGAMLAGLVCATVTSLCYGWVQPWVRRKGLFHDTCGVTYLHGLPGFVGGITSAIVAARGRGNLGPNYGVIYFDNEAFRTASQQAGFQLAAIGLAIGLGVLGGLIAGFVTSSQFFNPPPLDGLFDDQTLWDECEIDHKTLHHLGLTVTKSIVQVDQSNTERSRINYSLVQSNPQTVADDQDIDILNLHKNNGPKGF